MVRRSMVNRLRLGSVTRCLSGMLFLLAAAGCGAVSRQDPWEVCYDPADGNSVENIRAHFNLHRGRWWNYYLRGTCFLAYEHYEAARADFNEAIARRSEDQRDARTYGMHFVDYFPNRERAIAVYLERITTPDPDAEKDLLSFRQAVAGLEKSLRREESSRAKFYWNRARREVLRRTTNDAAGPLISVRRPICTNRRTVWFDVTATDRQSGVVEIQIGASHGSLAIAQPKFLIELAEEQVTRTVEVTLTPGRPMAVVEITATDLVGNTSPPTEALIILDPRSPQAAVAVRDDPERGRWTRVSRAARSGAWPPRYGVAAENWDCSALPALASVPGAHLQLGSVFTTGRVGSWTSSLVHVEGLALGGMRGSGAPTSYFPPRVYQEPAAVGIRDRTGNLDPGGVYQVLWLLFFSEYSWDIPVGPAADNTRREVYWTTCRALRDLPIRSGPREGLPARFGVHDVGTVYGKPVEQVWNIRENTVVEDLWGWQRHGPPVGSVGPTYIDRTPIDLVVYGELQVRREEGEERFELTLRARDFLNRKDLAFRRMEAPFPGVEPQGETQVLVDIHGEVRELECRIKDRSSRVSQMIPRLQAEVSFARNPWYSLRRSEVRINVGENDGVFEGMRLGFYAEGDPNRICAGEIVSVGNGFSVVKPERQHERLKDGVVAVTK